MNPALHVAELARVLRADGTAFVITPNAPADFENPFHVYLFEPEHLVSLLSLFFEDVDCFGLEGDEVLKADFAARRASGERLLQLDVARPAPPDATARVRLGLRARPPAHLPLPRRRRSGIGSGLDASHFFMTRVDVRPTHPCSSRSRAARAHRRPATDRIMTKVWVTVPTLDEVENIDLLIQRVRDRGPRRAHPDRRRRQPRRHRREGRGARRRARRHRGAAPAAEDGARERVPRRSRDRHRPRLRRHGPDRRRPLARPGRAPRAARGGRTGRRPRDRLPLRARRRGAELAEAAPAGSRCGATATPASCSGSGVRDTTAGYRAYRASILRAMDIESTHSTGYAFQIEMTYRVRASPAGASRKSRSRSPTVFAAPRRCRGASSPRRLLLVTLWGLRDRVASPKRFLPPEHCPRPYAPG